MQYKILSCCYGAANLLTNETILEATDDLTHLNFDATNQLPDENLGIGDNTWAELALVEQEHDTKSFFASIRNFFSHLSRRC